MIAGKTLLDYFKKEEEPAHITQRSIMLKLFIQLDFVPSGMLRTFAYQYNARIYELRRLGYVIKATKKDGVFGYIMEKVQ